MTNDSKSIESEPRTTENCRVGKPESRECGNFVLLIRKLVLDCVESDSGNFLGVSRSCPSRWSEQTYSPSGSLGTPVVWSVAWRDGRNSLGRKARLLELDFAAIEKSLCPSWRRSPGVTGSRGW